MEQNESDKLLDFFKALGNESRLKIVGLLALKEHSVVDLATALQLKEPAVSHHLARLKDLDLVQVRAAGHNRIYSLRPETLIAMNKDIFTPQQTDPLVAQFAGEAWERQILGNYLEGDRLTQLPAQLKKRRVVLKWLAERFEMDRRYPEREVNEIISRHHPDYASLRRALVDHGLMARDAGTYWRLPTPEWA